MRYVEMLHEALKNITQNKVDPNEPVFLLRGQDQVAYLAVICWALCNEAADGDTTLSMSAREDAEAMRLWEPRQLATP